MRSFAKIKPSRNDESTLSLTNVGKLSQICDFLTWQIRLLKLFTKIKFTKIKFSKISEFTVFTIFGPIVGEILYKIG